MALMRLPLRPPDQRGLPHLETAAPRLPPVAWRQPSPAPRLGDIAAIMPDQPLPLAADKGDRQITAAERRSLHRKAAAVIIREPVRRRH